MNPMLPQDEAETTDDNLLSVLRQMLGSSLPADATLTLIVCLGDEQDVISDDSDLEDLIAGVYEELVNDPEFRAMGPRRLKPVH